MKIVADRSAGLLAVLAGSLSFREACRLYPFHVSLLGGDHLFPAFIGAGLVVAGIWLTLFPRKAADIAVASGDGKGALVLFSKPAAIPLLLLLYTFLLPAAGYPASTFFAAVFLFRLLRVDGWWRSILYALLLTAGLYLVFIEWLHTPFPAGSGPAAFKELIK